MTGDPATRAAGAAIGALLIAATIYLATVLPLLTLSSTLLLLLFEVVLVAVTTTMWVSVVTAVAAVLLANWFLVQPHHTFLVSNPDDVVVLLIFVLTAIGASALVTRAQDSRAEAARRGSEAAALRASVDRPAGEVDPDTVLHHLRDSFALDWVEIRDSAGRVVATTGRRDDPALDDVLIDESLPDGYQLLGEAPERLGVDRPMLLSLGTAAVRARQARDLASEAARADELAAVDRARSALLAAVGHDLRTPIAAITVAAGALHAPVPEEHAEELVATIEGSAQRLDHLVTNLLDMSRLEAGSLITELGPVAVAETLAQVAADAGSDRVSLEAPEDLPDAWADEGLLERVVANLVSKALNHTDSPVVLGARAEGDEIIIDVVDQGPGLSETSHPFDEFGTAGDRAPSGLGLGLTIARGFTTAMHGTLTPYPTPGGGLTMSLRLPLAP
ncbi:MAG: DUF4118 domain-containing protein [Candidatus Nanopelagicales bacterium]